MHLTAHWDELSGQSSVDYRASVCPYTMYAVTPQCTHTYSEANEALGDRTHLKMFLRLLDSVYVYLCMKPRIILYRYCTYRTFHKAKRSPHSFTPFVFSPLPPITIFTPAHHQSQWSVGSFQNIPVSKKKKKQTSCFLKKQKKKQLLSYYRMQHHS